MPREPLVPQSDHPRALAFVNDLRERHGIGPALDDIPCGDHSGYSCPLARALEVGDDASPAKYVGKAWVRIGDSIIRMPHDVAAWVHRFDAGAFPELERQT